MRAKSDCAVAYAPAAGPLSIRLESSVESLFGAAILSVAKATALEFGVSGGEISIDDDGALDYVVAARVESALRAAGFQRHGPAKSVFKAGGGIKVRRRRSRLYLPGNQPDFFPNAGLFAADCLIIDLEDSVPVSRKDEARIICRRLLEGHRAFFGASEIIVRINPLSSAWGRSDLAELAAAPPHALILPKCESAEDVAELARGLDRVDDGSGEILIMPIIETARGVLAAAAIAAASPRVAALCFGAEDYSRDIGARRTATGSEAVYARQAVVASAKAAGVQALDSVFSDVEDLAGFEAWCLGSRALGFDGIGLIHPRQISVANRAYAPTGEELEEALRIVAALDEAEALGSGVASLDGSMIDAPVAARARRVLASGAPDATREG